MFPAEVVSYETRAELRELLAAAVVPEYVSNAQARKRQRQQLQRRAKKRAREEGARACRAALGLVHNDDDDTDDHNSGPSNREDSTLAPSA